MCYRLVVVHGFNGQTMEKYYIVGSVFVAICLTVPPYAAGQYGLVGSYSLLCLIQSHKDIYAISLDGIHSNMIAGIQTMTQENDLHGR